MAAKTSKSASGAQQALGFIYFVSKWLFRVLIVSLLVPVARYLDSIKDRWYVFTPEFIHAVAQDAIAASPKDDTTAIVSHITRNLTSTFPSSQIALNPNTEEWVFNNAGGAMGAMYIIHASITEYLIVFGTPLGHTGLHTADDYFNILVGEQWAFSPPNLTMERYPAGSVHHLPRGHTKQYKMHEGCYALKYARGWIPLMLPFGFADGFTSTLDVPTLFNTRPEVLERSICWFRTHGHVVESGSAEESTSHDSHELLGT